MLNDADKVKIREHWQRAVQDPATADDLWFDFNAAGELIGFRPLSEKYNECLNDSQSAEEVFADIESRLKVNVDPEYHQFAYDDVEAYIKATEELLAQCKDYRLLHNTP